MVQGFRPQAFSMPAKEAKNGPIVTLNAVRMSRDAIVTIAARIRYFPVLSFTVTALVNSAWFVPFLFSKFVITPAVNFVQQPSGLIPGMAGSVFCHISHRSSGE